MPIKKTEFLDDRVKVHFHLSKPDGIPDVDGVIEVPYDSIAELPVPLETVGLGTRWEEGVFVPSVNKTIVFIFDSYQERGAGPNEEDIYGPYLKNET